MPRFLFHGSCLAHRCHRQPIKNTSSQSQQQFLGARPLYAETQQVRHVGNAMVIKHEAHVAPLFVAHIDGITDSSSTAASAQAVVPAPEPKPNPNHIGQVGFVARRQVVDPRDEELFWLAPYEHQFLAGGHMESHAIKTRRAFEKRSRQKDRRLMRELRAEDLRVNG